jgi:hypothetical protein
MDGALRGGEAGTSAVVKGGSATSTFGVRVLRQLPSNASASPATHDLKTHYSLSIHASIHLLDGDKASRTIAHCNNGAP